MSIFDLPKVSQDDIVEDIKRRIANSQTVTEDDLRRLTGSNEPQVIVPLGMFTKLLEKLAPPQGRERAAEGGVAESAAVCSN